MKTNFKLLQALLHGLLLRFFFFTTVIFSSYTRVTGNGLCNLEPQSGDEDDIWTVSQHSPNFHTTSALQFQRFNEQMPSHTEILGLEPRLDNADHELANMTTQLLRPYKPF
ncbi:UNVERIFIED_CONTAM: hypothetical protein NCL1_53254 [Trichonephila clavipes]